MSATKNRSTQAIKAAKDEIREELRRATARCPASVQSGSVNLVRDWKASMERAKKAMAKRGTESDLTAALSDLRRFA